VRQAAIAEAEAEGGSPDAAPVPEPVRQAVPNAPVVRSPEQRVGRNEPCPCGSGKKYKLCHGR
jgi:preprotein translocase subunit SecA